MVNVVDISYDGCGIEITEPLSVGEPVKLKVLDRGELSATVRWWDEGKAGLKFSPVEEERLEQPRATPRENLSVDVHLRRIGHSTFRVMVFNISSTGCMVELVEKPRLDEHMIIRFAGLQPIEAEICWVEEHRAGLRFLRPIHPAVFELLKARLSANVY